MHWRKLGRLYDPVSIHPKLATHAANPLAILIKGDVYRIFYSGRDTQNRSSVGFVDADILRREIIRIHDAPVFEYGPKGSFYSHGVSMGNWYEADGQRFILFMGWQCPSGGHWRGDIGRLILGDDLSLRLDGSAPFMSTNVIDPVSLSYPWVLRDGVDEYHMWYGSTITWDSGNGEMIHVINHAVSDNGHIWQRNGLAVPYCLGTAQAFSRPSIIGNKCSGYEMWFSYRGRAGTKYRIGYATSEDGKIWNLKLDQVGINTSPSDWDSEMIEYPFVFDHNGQRFMLYNGNSYGRTGFGLAVLT